MDEFKHVLRIFVFAGILMFISQFKYNGQSLESHTEGLLVRSSMAHSLRDIAHSGAIIIESKYYQAKNYLFGKSQHSDPGAHFEDRD